MSTIEDKELGDVFFSPFHFKVQKNETAGSFERVIEKAEFIPFVISGVKGYDALKLGIEVGEALKVSFDVLLIIDNGDGLTVGLQPKKDITEIDFLELEPHYVEVQRNLQVSLRARGYADICVLKAWSKDALLPLPGSLRLLGEEEFKVKLVNSNVIAQDFDLWFDSGLKAMKVGDDTTPPEHIKAFPKPDTAAVLEGCVFLRERAPLRDLPKKEQEAALSLLAHVAGKGDAESLDLSYKALREWGETDLTHMSAQIARACGYGPRTCANVDKVCGKRSVCKQCPHWGKINSPVQIQGENFVATERTGFHLLSVDEKGKSKKTPDFEGLRRYYYNQAPYVSIADSEATFRFTGKVWKPVFDLELKAFAQKKFKPLADTRMVNEFLSMVKRTELRAHAWFTDSTNNKMNFQNGVLDIKTLEFEKHSPQYGFRTVLPYDYDRDAICPRFEQFLREVTLDRQELIDIILEFAGYSLSGDKCWEQKAIVLLGEGQNGKSKLVSVIKALAGEGASTSQTFVDLEKDTNRAALDGSLFNIAEETPSKSLMDSSLFKALIGGAEVSVKRLYEQPFEIRNRAKFWMLCNEMPRSADKAHAMLRRLVICPFEAMFTGEKDDKRIEEKLMPELPGILNLVLSAYRRMLERGGLPESQIAKNHLNSYREENDNVYRWFIECCDDLGPSSEYFTKPRELFASYQKYVIDQGEKPATQPSFVKRLAVMWKSYAQRTIKKRVAYNAEAERVITGLKVKEEYQVRLISLVK